MLNRRLGRVPQLEYLLRAPFDVADQGYANGQVIDIRNEGITDGQLTVVEVDGTLAVVSNKCAFTAQGTPLVGDLGFYSQAITKVLGRGLLVTMNIDVTNGMLYPIHWNANADVDFVAPSYDLNPIATGVVRAYVRGVGGAVLDSSSDLFTYAAATDYHCALVLGGYDVNGVPWRGGEAAANYLYGASWYMQGGVFTDWTLLWHSAARNDTPLYASFFNYHSTGTIDNFRIPDKDLSAVLQPNNLSLYADAGELDAYTPELGGGWTEDIGDWDTAAGVLTATTLGIATFTGLADCIYDTEITMPAAGVVAGGLVVRGSDYTGGSEDYWYIKCTPATAGNDFEIIEYAGGVVTQRAVTDVDFIAATAYNIRAICDTQTISAFVDGGDKISYASAASGQAATDFGLRDEGNGNMTFDKTALFARTSATYDAVLDSV